MTARADREFDYLDDEERELVESIENGDWEPVEDVEEAKAQAHRYAAATLQQLDEPSAHLTVRDGDLDWKRYSESIRNVTPERLLSMDYEIGKSA